jgi:hypothetical protein
MTELSPRARALFEAGRRSLQPTEQDRLRNLQALSQHIEGLEPTRDPAPRASTPASAWGWPGSAAIVVGLALVGAGVFQMAGPQSKAAPPAAVSAASLASTPVPAATPTQRVPASSVAIASSESAAVDVPPTPRASARASTSAKAGDRLAEEVTLLSDAERDLRAGQYQDALRVLNEHRRKFPQGALAQERIAARVQALCGLGRVGEAQAELARLSPKSLHGSRAEACTSNR